jgi:repressor LexA
MAVQRPKLTPRQTLVMAFIAERIHAHGYPPTIREIGRAFGINSTNGVADHIKALARKGYISHEEGKSRTLRLTPREAMSWHTSASGQNDTDQENEGSTAALQGHKAPSKVTSNAQRPGPCVRVPMLGRVAAGVPILATEEARPEDHLFVDRAWLGQGEEVFALEVSGVSMIEAGILDGDTVFVKRRNYAETGDMAVVMIDNEATIKYYFPETDRLRLQPANAAMAPLYVYPSAAHTVLVIGLVVGVYRRI